MFYVVLKGYTVLMMAEERHVLETVQRQTQGGPYRTV